MKSYFEYYETDAEANPKEKPLRINYSDVRTSLSLRYPGPLLNLLWFIQLAASAPKHPVDVTHFKDGALVYSGRLVYHTGEDEKPLIFLG
jgi:hypothetical protein